MCALNHERQTSCECYVARDNTNQKPKMKFTTSSIALAGAAIIVVASAMRPQSATAATAEPTAQPKQSEIDSANRLFQAGKFAEAGKLYSQIVAQNPKDYSATLQLGRIALLSNRLDDTQKWLEKAISPAAGERRSQRSCWPRRFIVATISQRQRLR